MTSKSVQCLVCATIVRENRSVSNFSSLQNPPTKFNLDIFQILCTSKGCFLKLYSAYLCRNLIHSQVCNSDPSTYLEDGDTLKIMKHEGNMKSGKLCLTAFCVIETAANVCKLQLRCCIFLSNSVKTNYFLNFWQKKMTLVMCFVEILFSIQELYLLYFDWFDWSVLVYFLKFHFKVNLGHLSQGI